MRFPRGIQEDEVAAATFHDGLVDLNPLLHGLMRDRGLGDRALLIRCKHDPRIVVASDNTSGTGAHR
jgi:hypothetical protein